MKTKSETDVLLGFESGSKTVKTKSGPDVPAPAPTPSPPTKTQMPMDAAQEVAEPGEPVLSGSDGGAVEDR